MQRNQRGKYSILGTQTAKWNKEDNVKSERGIQQRDRNAEETTLGNAVSLVEWTKDSTESLVEWTKDSTETLGLKKRVRN